MTENLQPLVALLDPSHCTHTYLTGPSTSPPSINNNADAAASLHSLIPILTDALLSQHAAFLVACYSAHPLVPWLRAHPTIQRTGAPVIGIFEASVLAALGTVGAGAPVDGDTGERTFGIVTTGAVWAPLLTDAVIQFLGGAGGAGGAGSRFVGVETTGLNATELHTADPADVRQRLIKATARLLARGSQGKSAVGAICLGCAGMAGMDATVREACVRELGEEEGNKVLVIDGVLAGVVWLEGMLRNKAVMKR